MATTMAATTATAARPPQHRLTSGRTAQLHNAGGDIGGFRRATWAERLPVMVIAPCAILSTAAILSSCPGQHPSEVNCNARIEFGRASVYTAAPRGNATPNKKCASAAAAAADVGRAPLRRRQRHSSDRANGPWGTAGFSSWPPRPRCKPRPARWRAALGCKAGLAGWPRAPASTAGSAGWP